jgi:hypothetical protein
MRVEVGFELEEAPTAEQLERLHADADALTDEPSSIEVRHDPMEDRHRLVTTFTMPDAAQYKAVDGIARQFTKVGFGSRYTYADVWIGFPSGRAPRRRRRS